MLVLFETQAGFAIFKLLDEEKLKSAEDFYLDFESPEKASSILKLCLFEKFEDTQEALLATTAVIENRLSKGLKKVLKKAKESFGLNEQLLVADSKLGSLIKEKMDMPCLYSSGIQELMRAIRAHIDSLIPSLEEKTMHSMALGLAHSLSRYKLKFSPDKVDTMIVQAISLLDDIDKELNNYVMRAREWYGWHFPELGKIVTDHLAYAKVIKLIGDRLNTHITDLSSILTEEQEQAVKSAAEISMGTEVKDSDIENILHLATQVVELTEYRGQLYEYLKNRMTAIAPNLTVLVGELVGARLIAKAGSLLNLSKQPASTVQILGAEKALFRALKKKHDTPKYGLLYHASLVGQATQKNKGKISRTLAAKASLATRVDALGEGELGAELGMHHRLLVEKRMKYLEEGNLKRISGTGKQRAAFDKYSNKSEIHVYNPVSDSTIPSSKIKRQLPDDSLTSTPEQPFKKVKIEVEAVSVKQEETETPKKKKKKQKLSQSVAETSQSAAETSQLSSTLDTTNTSTTEDTSMKKKKKKKKKEKKEKDAE